VRSGAERSVEAQESHDASIRCYYLIRACRIGDGVGDAVAWLSLFAGETRHEVIVANCAAGKTDQPKHPQEQSAGRGDAWPGLAASVPRSIAADNGTRKRTSQGATLM